MIKEAVINVRVTAQFAFSATLRSQPSRSGSCDGQCAGAPRITTTHPIVMKLVLTRLCPYSSRTAVVARVKP